MNNHNSDNLHGIKLIVDRIRVSQLVSVIVFNLILFTVAMIYIFKFFVPSVLVPLERLDSPIIVEYLYDGYLRVVLICLVWFFMYLSCNVFLLKTIVGIKKLLK